jgi:hypothetical protein
VYLNALCAEKLIRFVVARAAAARPEAQEIRFRRVDRRWAVRQGLLKLHRQHKDDYDDNGTGYNIVGHPHESEVLRRCRRTTLWYNTLTDRGERRT